MTAMLRFTVKEAYEMKKQTLFLLFAVTIVLFLSNCATTPDEAYKEYIHSYSRDVPTVGGQRLGVLPFDCPHAALSKAVSEEVAMNLHGSGFEIVEYSELSQMLRRNGLDIETLLEDKDFAQISSVTGVPYLLTGKVLLKSIRWKRVVRVSAKILDGNTGKVLIKTTFTPPRRYNKIPAIGEALGFAIKEELGVTKDSSKK
ncbi:MAG: hypothetical protein JRJ31_21510 [Deltaproteobacteria bacterium]|nr:hypothetical protein [Deltaproteobacteria bacterium]